MLPAIIFFKAGSFVIMARELLYIELSENDAAFLKTHHAESIACIF